MWWMFWVACVGSPRGVSTDGDVVAEELREGLGLDEAEERAVIAAIRAADDRAGAAHVRNLTAVARSRGCRGPCLVELLERWSKLRSAADDRVAADQVIDELAPGPDDGLR